MREYLLHLFEHVAWADARVLEALRAARLPADRARLLFAHLLAAERVWLSRMMGEAVPPVAVWPDLALEECADLAVRNAAEIRGWIESAPALALAADVDYRNTRGDAFRNTAQDILTHVAMHGAYHRGQIAAALREAGVDPPNTDFIMWLRESMH